MPYTTPPVFADSNVLSAAQMNILSDDIEFEYSIISGVNTPFCGDNLTASGNSRTYTFRRQGRYLHYKFRQTAGDSDEVTIRLNGANVYGDGTNRSAPYTWSNKVDLNGIGSPPAVGAFYEVYVEYVLVSTGTFHIDYLIESDSTTL